MGTATRPWRKTAALLLGSVLCLPAFAAPADPPPALSPAWKLIRAARDAGPADSGRVSAPRLVYRGLVSWDSNAQLRRDALMLPTARLQEQADRQLLESLNHRRIFREHRMLRSVKNGLGFDYLLNEIAAVHFDLHARRKLKRPGLRIRANADEPAAVVYHRRWSVGAVLDPLRTEDGDRYLQLVPQLRMNFDGAAGPATRCRGLIEFGHWRGSNKKVTTDEQMVQASLQMTF